MEMESNDSELTTSDEDDTSEVEDNDVDESNGSVIAPDLDGWIEGIINDESFIESIEQDALRKCIYKCRELVKMIRKSTILIGFIDQWKKDYNVKSTLNLDSRSRWNSTLFLIETIIEHRMVIIRLMAEKYELELKKKQTNKLIDLEITKEKWMLLKSMEYKWVSAGTQHPGTSAPAQHLGTCPAPTAPICTYSTQSAPTADFTMSTYSTYSTFDHISTILSAFSAPGGKT